MTSQSVPAARVILKLRDPQLDPARPEVLHDLSQQAGLSLEYLRAMSGGAHVLTVSAGTTPEALAEGLRRLRAFAAVEYAEPDQMMRHQKADDRR